MRPVTEKLMDIVWGYRGQAEGSPQPSPPPSPPPYTHGPSWARQSFVTVASFGSPHHSSDHGDEDGGGEHTGNSSFRATAFLLRRWRWCLIPPVFVALTFPVELAIHACSRCCCCCARGRLQNTTAAMVPMLHDVAVASEQPQQRQWVGGAVVAPRR